MLQHQGLTPQVMRKSWIEYVSQPTRSPMTYWVHQARGSAAAENVAPRPIENFGQPRVVGKGYALFNVEFNGLHLVFATLREIEVCIAVLEQKHLPRTIDLARQHGSGHGPNSHWLSRLPARVKPWRYRSRLTTYLKRALVDFRAEISKLN